MDIIRAGDGGFVATMVPAEFEILMALVSFLGDPGDRGSFHWAGSLSPERERIIGLISPIFASFRSTSRPAVIEMREGPTELPLLNSRELKKLGRMFLHGVRELDEEFEIITAWHPHFAIDAASDIARATHP